MTEAAKAAEFDVKYDVDADIEAAIEACGGDVRAALRATLVANAFLEDNLEKTLALVSTGFCAVKTARAGRQRNPRRRPPHIPNRPRGLNPPGGGDRPSVQGWSVNGPRRAVPAVASARAGLFFTTKKCDTCFGLPSNRGGLSKCRTSLKLLKSFASVSPTSPTTLPFSLDISTSFFPVGHFGKGGAL